MTADVIDLDARRRGHVRRPRPTVAQARAEYHPAGGLFLGLVTFATGRVAHRVDLDTTEDMAVVAAAVRRHRILPAYTGRPAGSTVTPSPPPTTRWCACGASRGGTRSAP